MTDDRDAAVRARAHQIWEEEGSPHGRHDQHWAQAERDVAEAGDQAGGVSAASDDAPALLPDSLNDDAPIGDPPAPAAAKRPRKPPVAASEAKPRGK